eukprot:scaffold7595_cov267-Pinguiococcus_pyrenoidosus.AAC.21
MRKGFETFAARPFERQRKQKDPDKEERAASGSPAESRGPSSQLLRRTHRRGDSVEGRMAAVRDRCVNAALSREAWCRSCRAGWARSLPLVRYKACEGVGKVGKKRWLLQLLHMKELANKIQKRPAAEMNDGNEEGFGGNRSPAKRPKLGASEDCAPEVEQSASANGLEEERSNDREEASSGEGVEDGRSHGSDAIASAKAPPRAIEGIAKVPEGSPATPTDDAGSPKGSVAEAEEYAELTESSPRELSVERANGEDAEGGMVEHSEASDSQVPDGTGLLLEDNQETVE